VIGYENIQHASLTDVGVRRSHNQDNHAVQLASDGPHWRQQGHLFLVADGMGGHAVGELASEMAVRTIAHTYGKHAPQGAPQALRKAFLEANAAIYARGQQNPEFREMGTTSTALVLRPEGAWVGHVGDSRAYRVRDGQIEQLTFDHSHVWDIARRLHVDPEGVQGIPSNLLIRSLGPQPLVQVDVEGPHPLREGDLFVLCSDGLTGQVSDHELGAVVSVLPPEEACRFLVDLANLRGGPDNITLTVIHVGDAAAPRPADEARPRAAWLRVVPWPVVALFAGILMTCGSIALTMADYPGRLPALLVSAGVVVAGLVGLVSHYGQEKRRAAAEAELPQLRIHRRTACRVEAPLLERMGKALQLLRQQAAERNWDADWAAYQGHYDEAERLQAHGDLPGAFRAYCRAMRFLTEALERQRQKAESFQPVWDKDANEG
jgi:protein phosphatase